MMIIGVDPFNRETIADRLVVGAIPETTENRRQANLFIDWLNELHCSDFGGTFYRLVADDYRLSRGMEDLI
jgi:hypothetical protein